MRHTSIGRVLRRLALCTALLTLLATFFAATAAATNGRVLILGPTVSGGVASREAQAAILVGRGVDVVSAATWTSMTTAQFAAYDALILGDPNCYGYGAPIPGPYQAAQDNAATWAAAVTGNVIINGTDPSFHAKPGLINPSVAFAVDSASDGKTGAYISLSCLYHLAPPSTIVSFLSGFGTFRAGEVGSCYNNAHIVATHPALASLTDAYLSNWSCSVHEGFTQWPLEFEVLAIARDAGSVYTAPDGSVGTPYIVARGVTVISDIDLAPETDTNPVGSSHTLTATVVEDGNPVSGTTVTFRVIAGPHTGVTGTGVTNASGMATFSYTGIAIGTDTIEATYVTSTGLTQRSNRVTKTWEISNADISIVKTGPATAPSGGTISYLVTVSNGGPANATNVIVDDLLPPSATLVSATPSQGSCSGTVTCNLGSIASGGSATVTIVVTTALAASGSTVCNSARARADQPDPNPANNSSTTCATVTPGPPATLTLAPATAENVVDSQHCVTATVRDAFGNLVSPTTVNFTVTGSVATTGSSTTLNGAAQFCYTGPALPGADVITATAVGGTNPSGTAAKTWVIPASTEGCKVTYGGRITAANGDKATFGGNAQANGLKGQEEYQDHGPAADINVHSIDVLSVVCSTGGKQASIFGTATVNGSGTFNYRIDLQDLAEPGSTDTYRIRLSTGYDSGVQVLEGGNVQIH